MKNNNVEMIYKKGKTKIGWGTEYMIDIIVL